jgi:SAM-dependent methyltransferase
MNITAIFWDAAAKRFDQQEARYPQMHIKILDNTKRYLSASDLVLDYGCATGEKALELAGHVKKIQGIDISSKMVAAASMNAVERKIQNVDFTQATIFDKRFEQESFDAILAFGILHLLKDLPQAIQRIYDLLKPGGRLISSIACMGDNESIPTWINRLLFIPGRIGLLPTLRFLKIPELEEAITRTSFQIIETETFPFSPTNNPTYIVGRFIAAKKE